MLKLIQGTESCLTGLAIGEGCCCFVRLAVLTVVGSGSELLIVTVLVETFSA